jgi:hypothetical protein
LDVVEKLPKWGTSSTMKSGGSVQQDLATGNGMLRYYISGIEIKKGYSLLTGPGKKTSAFLRSYWRFLASTNKVFL